jgi:hypothetical protein
MNFTCRTGHHIHAFASIFQRHYGMSGSLTYLTAEHATRLVGGQPLIVPCGPSGYLLFICINIAANHCGIPSFAQNAVLPFSCYCIDASFRILHIPGFGIHYSRHESPYMRYLREFILHFGLVLRRPFLFRSECKLYHWSIFHCYSIF